MKSTEFVCIIMGYKILELRQLSQAYMYSQTHISRLRKVFLPISLFVYCRSTTFTLLTFITFYNYSFCNLRVFVEQVDQNNFQCLYQEEDVHVLAGSLKLFFREMKEPLISYDLFEKSFEAISKICLY